MLLYYKKDIPSRRLHGTPINRLHKDYSHCKFHQKEKHVSFNHLIQKTLPQKCNPVEGDNMYAFSNAIYDVIGETELQQNIRFKKYNPKFIFVINKVKIAKPPARYNYDVEALLSTDILIEERNVTAPTGGGSSFLVRIESGSIQISHYDDFFNGTYVAHCPLPECTYRNISVWLHHSSYTTYTGIQYPIEKLLWRQRSCYFHKGTAGLTTTRRDMKSSTNGTKTLSRGI